MVRKRERAIKSGELEEIAVCPCIAIRMEDGHGGTLELMKWKGEPAVLVDGAYILRRSILVRELAKARKA